MCLNEYRLWTKISESYPDYIVKVIGVCTSNDKEAIAKFIQNKNIKFPILWDPEKEIKTSMEFRQSPLMILLDSNNKIMSIERTITTTEQQQYFLTYLEQKIEGSINNKNKGNQ